MGWFCTPVLSWKCFDIFVCVLYFLFYFSFFHLIKDIKLNKLFIFAIFSPISFFFPILNSKATGQKEIIFLSLLSIFCFFLPKLKKSYANFFMIFIALLIGLSHEGLIFYLFYLIIPFILFYNFKNLKNIFFNLLPIFFVMVSMLFLTYHFHGTEKHVVEICNSVKNYVITECQNVGQIAALGFISSLEWNVAFKEIIGKQNGVYGLPIFPKYYIIYGIGFIIGFLPLFFLFGNSKLNKYSFNFFKVKPLIILLFPFLMTSPIYYAGFDWGRYLYISYMSSLVTIIFYLKNNILYIREKTNKIQNNLITKYLFIILIVIYGFGWTVPICCELNFKPGISSVIKRVIYYYDK